MKTVFIYRGSGRFGGGEFEWNNPPLGSKHDFMLFLLQDRDEQMPKEARAQLTRYGFVQVKLFDGRKIMVEALNEPSLAAFQSNYQGALDDGVSLAWYP